MQTLAAAIDLGGTNTRIAFIDREGNILHKESMPTGNDGPVEFTHRVTGAIRQSFSEFEKKYSLAGLGMGAPNANYFKGTIEYPANLNWKGVTPLAKYFKDELGVPVVMTNDANAAALGELYFGAARGMKDFLFITLGTGLGSGVVVNGQLVYGHDGFAGELGHTIIIQHGRQCGCGRKGCLEQYCSATGIVKTYKEILLSDNPDIASRNDFGDIDAEYIYEKAMCGDEAAFYAFNYTGEMLGFALSNFAAFTSPEAIFLFGGLALSGEILFNPVSISFEKNLLPVYRNKIRILPSGLPENEAGLLGAASIIWNEIEGK